MPDVWDRAQTAERLPLQIVGSAGDVKDCADLPWCQARDQSDETAGEALQRMLAGHVIEVDDDTYTELVARSETFGESASEVMALS